MNKLNEGKRETSKENQKTRKDTDQFQINGGHK